MEQGTQDVEVLDLDRKQLAEDQANARTEQRKAKEQKGIVVAIKTDGALDFSNQTELGQAARLMIKMKMAPNHLIEAGLEAVMSAMLFCKQHQLPITAMNELAFIKGKLACFGSLFTAIAERHPEYGEKEEFFITKEGERICSENKNLQAEAWAHVMRVKKKGGTVWNEYYFSVDDANQAGLLTENTKKDSGWIKYTKDLLFHKNKSRALKSNYASALNGINYYEDLKEIKEAKHISEEMNEVFGGQQ
jgi:hypothetical protein